VTPPKVAYRRCLVSFFDILGFRDIVNKKEPGEIASLMDLFQSTGKISPETEEAFEARSFQFSDCIVRMMPLDSDANTRYPMGILFHEILAIVHAALEMANRGTLLRGGLTIGDVYYSESTVFGPAMIHAYELESRAAVYPRVVVDPAVVEALKSEPLLKKDTHQTSDEVAEVLQLLRRDADGVWFVDFLHAALGEVDEPHLYEQLLDKHKKCVEKALGNCKKLDDVAIKVLWAAHYHNQVLDRLVADGDNRDIIKKHRITIPPMLLGGA
jgi:class 3 adenylate cyclase